ncbi:MAG: porphobilinogen synthase [Planctomycetes bacterium]|nr:porphobilinogen synthase [Planctomycetota bacterium]
MPFPLTRLRRLRRSSAWRSLVRETTLAPGDFIWPIFVRPGKRVRRPVASMPGVFQFSVDEAAREAAEAFRLGIRAVILFGIPAVKDARGSGAYDPKGGVPQAIRAIRVAVPELVVMADVCCCEYTDHGHCGILDKARTEVDNDATLAVLAQAAVAYAAAGAQCVAPSAMMDGQVRSIREALDRDGRGDVAVLAYAAKFASGFYGPFRDAAESPPKFGDRSGYQMDPANIREALREIESDREEGADLVMVKPALAYLDVIRAARERTDLPLCAYNVSGEYSMIKAAAERGWCDERRCALEVLTAIRRAGADAILTYWAKDAAKWIG